MGPDQPLKLPRLRWKGRWAYFDAGGKPRRWIPLGNDPAAIRHRYDRLVVESSPARGTVDAMVAEYLTSPRNPLALGTLRNYRTYRGHLAAVFGHMDPAELTQADILQYLDECPRMTFRGEIALLSLAYKGWMRQRRLTFNPCFGVRCDRKGSKRTRLLEPAEIDAIVTQADERLAVAIELAYALGLRIGDLCRLRWADFAGSVETRKTGVRQSYEVTPDLDALLDRARAVQARVASLHVLCDRRGRPWKPEALRYRWHQARKAAGVEDAIPHDLRAAGGTEVDRQGGNAQRFLGHKSRQTTETYLRDKRVNVVRPLARKGAT